MWISCTFSCWELLNLLVLRIDIYHQFLKILYHLSRYSSICFLFSLGTLMKQPSLEALLLFFKKQSYPVYFVLRKTEDIMKARCLVAAI